MAEYEAPTPPVCVRVALGHGRLMVYSRHRQADLHTITCQPLAGGMVAELDGQAARQLYAELHIALGFHTADVPPAMPGPAIHIELPADGGGPNLHTLANEAYQAGRRSRG